MVRWSIFILFALVLGATTTVGIALACARWSRPTTFAAGRFDSVDTNSPSADWLDPHQDQGSARLYADIWQIDSADIDASPGHQQALQSLARRIPSRYPNVIFEEYSLSEVVTGCGVLWMRASRRELNAWPDFPGSPWEAIEKRYGWPLFCLSSGDHEISSFPPPGVIRKFPIRENIRERYHRRPATGADRVLDTPRAILWSGFITNTLLFSAPWLLGMIGIPAARRWLRSRRGRCRICGYDLRGDLARGCPECGWGRSEEEPRRHGGTERGRESDDRAPPGVSKRMY